MTRAELAAAGFTVDERLHARLVRYVALLLDENRSLNLTSTREEADVWAVHICDSLALREVIADERPARLLDLGTGGGLPGIPIACAYDAVHVTLLDARRKKIQAVRRICDALALDNVVAKWGRAEEIARDKEYAAQFDLVTARAIATLSALVELAGPLLRPGGACWFYKSSVGAEAEMPAAEAPAAKHQLKHTRVVQYTLPPEHGRRVLVGYRKLTPATSARTP